MLVVELSLVFGHWLFADAAPAARAAVAPAPADTPNTQALGQIIYDDYILVFQLSGLILLVAMIGAIVLTLRSREGVKKQRISDQLARTREQSVEIKQIEPGSGV